jgi:hypothetical protein
MPLSWRSTPQEQPTSLPNRAIAIGSVLWFVGLWCVGVTGAILLALPFRLLMLAAMH